MNYVPDVSIVHVAVVILIFALMILLTYLAFRLGETIVNKIGPNLITVIGKIMGLILAIIGTNMIIEGIKLAFNI